MTNLTEPGYGNQVTIVHQLGNGEDFMYVHGIAARDGNGNHATDGEWMNVTPARYDLIADDDDVSPVLVLVVEPSEDAAPYVAALAEAGIEVTGMSGSDEWVGVQTAGLL